jgi:hypothetical protein
MFKRTVQAGVRVGLILGAMLLSPMLAGAQPLADRVPADACVYVGWAGISKMGPEYNDTHFKAVLEASDFGRLIHEYLPQVTPGLPGVANDADQKAATQVTAQVMSAMWEYPSAMVISGVVERSPGELVPKVLFLFEPGDQLEPIRARLQGFLDASKELKGRVRVVVQQGYLGLTTGYKPDELAIAGPSTEKGVRVDALINNNAFRNAMSRLQPAPKAALYVQLESIMTQTEKRIADAAKEKPADSPEALRLSRYRAVRDGLGLTGAPYFAASGGFEGKDWGVRAYLSAPLPRKGIVSLIDSGPINQNFMRAVPKNPDMAVVARFDVGKLVSQMTQAVKDISPEGAKGIEAFLAAPTFAPDVNLRTELLEVMGDHWACYCDPQTTGRGPMGWVMVARPTDPGQVEASLTKLIGKGTGAYNLWARGRSEVTLINDRVGPYDVHTLATPGVSPSWVVADGNLYAAMFPQNAVAAADQVSRNKPSMVDNVDLKAMTDKTGIKGINGLKYYDLEATAPDAYPVLLTISRLVMGSMDMKATPSPQSVVPKLSDFNGHLGRAVYVTWADASGWTLSGKTPFPGAELFGLRMDTALFLSGAAVGGK